jgi:hypothetical protein
VLPLRWCSGWTRNRVICIYFSTLAKLPGRGRSANLGQDD